MPIARFQLPDGRVARFEVPEGTSPEAAQQMMEEQLPSILKPPAPPKPETTFGGNVKEFAKGIVPGAIGLAESAATGASALLPEEMEKSARKTISETAAAAKKPFEAEKGYEESIGRKFGEAVGSTVPFFAMGPLGAAGRIGATGLGVGAGAGEARTRAEQEGATGGQRAGATALGAVVGATEMLPVFHFIENLASPIKKGIMGMITRAAATGGAEGAQEAAAQIAQNLIAKGIYKPDQAIIEQVGESAAYGTATGALIQALTDMALGRRAGQGSSTSAGKPTDIEAEHQARRLAREQEQMGVKQGREAREEAALTRAKGRGAQGELFSGLPKAEGQRDLFGNLISPLPPETIQEETAGVPEGQMDLGLEGTRGYAELEAEKQQLLALKKQEKDNKIPRKERTQGIDERVAEISAMQKEFVRLSDKAKEGTQGSLFTPQELGGLDTEKGAGVTPIKVPKQTKQRAGVAPAGEQLGLGVEAIREYADLVQERERLERLPQTPEIKARLADLQQQTRDRDLFALDQLYAGKADAAEQEAKQAESAFAAPDEQPVTPEPTLVQKPEPLTPTTVPTTVTPDVLGALGIGRTAIIRKPDHGIMGKDIADPAQAAEVKSILEAYRQGRSAPIQEKIDAYLARPEFQAIAPTEETKKGEKDARQIKPTASRDGVSVSGQAAERKPARRTLTVKRNGVVSPKPDVVEPTVGEAEQSVAVGEAAPKKPIGMFDQLVKREINPDAADVKEEGRKLKSLPDDIEAEIPPFDPWDPKSYQGLAQGIEKETTRSKEEVAQDLIDEKRANRASREGRTSKQATVEGQTLEELKAEIAKGKGILANALRRMVQSGKVKLEEKHPSGEKFGGYFDGKTITLYADGIPAGDVLAVALHEVGAHLGLKNLLGATQYANIVKRIQEMAKSKEASPARALAQRALSRIPKEDLARGDEVIDDETIAYFIEELVKAQTKGELQLVSPARALWNQIKAAIQATFNRVFGTNLGVDAFTPEQIGLLANAAFTKESFTAPKEGTADLASRTDTFTDAFRKWFGDSKVVDADGKPLVVYHATRNFEGNEFKPSPKVNRVGNPDGYYFTYDIEDANRYAGETEGAEIIPTYLSIQNPFNYVGKFSPSKKMIAQYEKELRQDNPNLKDDWINAKLNIFKDGYWPNISFPTDAMTRVIKAGGYDGMKDGRDWVAFEPTQIKSAIGNTGAFDINNPDIRFSKAQGYTQQDYDEVNRIANSYGPAAAPAVGGLINTSLNAMNRATENSGVVTTLRQAVVDKYASVESRVSNLFSKGVRDAFGNLNPMVLVRQAEDHAKVFMSFLSDGGIKFNKEGLVETFKQVGSAVQALKEIDQFAKDAGISFDEAKTYVSSVLEGHRAYDIQENHNKPLEASALLLEQQGKNKQADAERDKKIKLHLSAADIATLEAKYQKTPAIQKIQDTFNQTRMQAVDLLAQSGRISKEQADDWKANSAYVPFDRVMEDIGVNLLPRGKGLGVMTKTPEIKGSLDRRVKDVVDSYMGTLGWMVEEALRHNASTKLLYEMELAGFAEKHKNINAAKNKNLVVRLYEDGKPVFYEVQNENDLLAFKQAPEVNNMLVNGLAATSRFLRVSVTAMPPFAVKQVIEDATRAAMYSGVERPLVVAMKTLYNMPRIFFGEILGRKSPAAKRMEELGIVGDYDFNIYQPTNEIEKEIGAKGRGVAGRIFHTLEKFTKASDLAARMAVYEETMRETNGDEVLAQTRARELINFNRRGSSSSMRVATRVIPFFNAYAQGMDVLYRAASGIDSSSAVERSAARRLFMGRVALMSAMGFAYAIAMSDDEGYKNATDDVRDNNWLIPNGYKLPVPKELGFMFKVIPERAVGYFRRYGTPEEQSAMDALSGVMKAAYSAYSSPTTVPSYVRPLLENMTNYSFFLQRELESASMQRLQPGQRATSSTSELAKGIGEATNISPIKIDNMLKGMFGMAGSTTLLATDAMLNPTRPDRPIYQMPFGSIFTYDTIGGRAKTEFYDLRERVSQADATYKEILKHDPEKAMKFYESNANLIAVAPMVNKSLKDLSNLRRMRTAIEQGTEENLGLDSKERRALIDELRGYENESVSYVRELEKSIRDLE